MTQNSILINMQTIITYKETLETSSSMYLILFYKILNIRYLYSFM